MCDNDAEMFAERVITIRDGIGERGHDCAKVDREIQWLNETVKRQGDALMSRPLPRDPGPKITMGTVYYVRVGANIKIGWTSDLAKRMRQYPPESILLATEPGLRALETRRHKMFATTRTHGREWYAAVPSLLHHIETLKSAHGEPDAVAFGAQPVTIPQHRDRQHIGQHIGRHISGRNV